MVAVDIGSVRPPSKFAWAAFDAPGCDVVDEGTDPQSAVSALVPGLLAGLAQGTWMLRQLAVTVPGLAVTTQPGSWRRGGAQLLLAEAFITASGKPEPLPAGQHAADAVAGGLALAEVLDSTAPPASPVRCAPQDPFNLLAAMALWAGLRIDLAELHAEVLAVAARPEPQTPRG